MANKPFAATVLTGAGAHERQRVNPTAEIIPVDLGESLPGALPAPPASAPNEANSPVQPVPQEVVLSPSPAPVAVPSAPSLARRGMRQSFTDARLFMRSLTEPPVEPESDGVYMKERDEDEPRGWFARWKRRFWLDRKMRGTWWAIRYCLRALGSRKSID